MYSKFWLIIRDDSKRTYEVCGQASSDNAFTNEVYGMQRTGMNVSSVILPVTNKISSRDLIKITAYVKEEGLYARMRAEHQKRIRDSANEWDED